MKRLDPMEELQRARLDGDLDSDGARQLAAAESLDPALAAEGVALRRVVDGLVDLPESVEPPRDLLPEILARLPEEAAPDRGNSRAAWFLAASLVAAVGFAFLAGRWTGLGENGAPAPTADRQLIVEAPATTPGSRPSLAAATSSLADTRLELRRAFDSSRVELPPETLALVESNLATIERAMAEIEAAIANNPADPELGRLLVAYQTREIALLLQAHRAAARL